MNTEFLRVVVPNSRHIRDWLESIDLGAWRGVMQLTSDTPREVTEGVRSNRVNLAVTGSDWAWECRLRPEQILVRLAVEPVRLSFIAHANETRTTDELIRGHSPAISSRYVDGAFDVACERVGLAVPGQIVRLDHATELAVVSGQTPLALDIVASGQTIRDLGLVEREVVMNVLPVLVASRECLADPVRARAARDIARRLQGINPGKGGGDG